MLYRLKIFYGNKIIYNKKIFSTTYQDILIFIQKFLLSHQLENIEQTTIQIFPIKKFNEFYELVNRGIAEEEIKSQLDLSVYKFNQFSYYYNYLQR